jgi:hypothetical protein
MDTVATCAVPNGWQAKLVQKLNNNELQTLQCTNPFVLHNAMMGIRKMCPIKNLDLKRDPETGYLVIPRKVKVDKADRKNKIQYTIGLNRLGGVNKCYYWDLCLVKVCKSKVGKFMVVNGQFEAPLIDMVEEMMGKYFSTTGRQDSDEPILISGTSFINVPLVSDVDKRKQFLQKFFVLSSDDNSTNLANNDVTEKFMLQPMSEGFYKHLFDIPEDKSVGNQVECMVGQVFNCVEEALEKRAVASLCTGGVKSESLFTLKLDPIIIIYHDKLNDHVKYAI